MQSQSWRAMRHLLSHPSLRNRVGQYLDDENEFVDLSIFDESWSSGQLAIIDLALSFHADKQLRLKESLEVVDPCVATLLVEAVEIFLGLPPSYPNYETKLFGRVFEDDHS